MRKLIAAAAMTAAVVATGLTGTPLAQANTARTVRTAAEQAAAYVPPAIAWGDCTDANAGGSADTLQFYGAQCGYLVVPLDYANPTGQRIRLAVSRVKHTTSAYQGVMLVNPGGPGGSGLVYSVINQAFGIPNHAGDSYDWIGFDPRGVGNSVPSLSCDASFFAPPRPPYRPTTTAIMNAWVTKSKNYATACTHAQGKFLFNHVKTTDSAQDMNSLRIALGQSQINYYGFSYGTYLGSVFMTMFPNEVRRFVLDSTVDPRNVWYQANLNQDVAFQKTFDIYFVWLAKYDSVYHLGNNNAAVRNLFLKTEAALDQNPADGVLGGDELLDVFTSAGYYVYGWTDIADAFAAYIHDGDPSGLIDMYESANPTTPGGDNSYTIYLATQCTDTQWPTDQNQLNQDSWNLDKKYNYFTWDNAWFNGPCAYWKYPAGTPVTVTGANVHVPILMIDETFDPATPYEGSLYVRSIFPTASLIEGKGGTTHAGSLSGVACTDDTIANYLATGVVPPRVSGDRSDKVCPPVPKPVPAGAAVTTASTASPAARLSTSVAAQLRAGIEQAAMPGR